MKRVYSIFILAAILLSPFCTTSYAVPMKEWTVAVFLNADNNLDPFGVEDQKEMSKVGSNEWLNIVSLIDRERGPACINYIEKGNIKKIRDLGELDMGDYREFVKFAKFIKENYPAKHYSFTIWNHGSGWKKLDKNIVRGISYDDSSRNHITNPQLGIAMAEIEKILGQKVDVLNMDACLMQLVEVAYVCKDHCRYMIASEEVEPGKGAPYDDILSGVRKDFDALAFSKNWVQAFGKSYNSGSQGFSDSTQSALDMSKMNALVDAINGFAKSAMSGKYAASFNKVLRKVQKFEYPENIDLIHFAELLKAELKGDESMKTACDKIIAASKDAIVENYITGFSTKNSKGIAICLPWDYSLESKYLGLRFSKETLWDDMINQMKRNDIALKIVENVETGSVDALKKFVAYAESNPEEKSLIRVVVRELNYEFYSENKLPEAIKAQVDELMNTLKSL